MLFDKFPQVVLNCDLRIDQVVTVSGFTLSILTFHQVGYMTLLSQAEEELAFKQFRIFLHGIGVGTIGCNNTI